MSQRCQQRTRAPQQIAQLARRSTLRIDEHSGVEHALWIEFSFCCPKRGREKTRALAIVPRPMITANSVMMRDRTTRLNQRFAGRILDRLPLLQKRTMAAECVERKVGRGPVRIDMSEAACDLAFHASRFEDRSLRRRLHFVVETFEPIPGDSGLKRVVDETGRCQKLARIWHANKCVPPDSCCAFEMCIAGSCGLRRPPWSAQHSSARAIQASGEWSPDSKPSTMIATLPSAAPVLNASCASRMRQFDG